MTAILLIAREPEAEPSTAASLIVALFPLVVLLPFFFILMRLVKRSTATQERARVHMDKMEALTERMVALLEASRGAAPPPPDSHSGR